MAPQLSTAPLRCLRTQLTSTSSVLPSSTRFLSRSPILARQTPSHLTVPQDQVPEYPYGPFYTYKQRNAGLYGGSKKQFGNVVAEKHRNKSRTSWLPNRHTKRLWSASLQAFIRVRLTAHVLHTIDRLGGIDEYLLGSKAARIKHLGPAGWRLRWKIMQSPAIQERFAKERESLGLPPKETGTAPYDFEIAAEGKSAKEVMDEVDAMLERDEEFVLEDPESEDAGKQAGFMHEEPQPGRPAVEGQLKQ
ncbi:hypothetical protein F5Y16DRAFT_390826 [Xylariaceae sp. FL0255]|nr:hypothetical protein F5Y16DRAFT_390826 [Xylariaceae sp. FL0255]